MTDKDKIPETVPNVPEAAAQARLKNKPFFIK